MKGHIIVENDSLSGELVAYRENDLGIVSQGKTISEAIKNLYKDEKIVRAFKRSVKTKRG